MTKHELTPEDKAILEDTISKLAQPERTADDAIRLVEELPAEMQVGVLKACINSFIFLTVNSHGEHAGSREGVAWR